MMPMNPMQPPPPAAAPAPARRRPAMKKKKVRATGDLAARLAGADKPPQGGSYSC
jgi:hypothetical protein